MTLLVTGCEDKIYTLNDLIADMKKENSHIKRILYFGSGKEYISVETESNEERN